LGILWLSVSGPIRIWKKPKVVKRGSKMGHFRGTPFGDPFWTNSRPGIWRGKAQIHSIVRLDDLGAIRNPPKMGQFGGSLHSVSLSRARAKVYTRASLHPGATSKIRGFGGSPEGARTLQTYYTMILGVWVSLRGSKMGQNSPFRGPRGSGSQDPTILGDA